MSQTISPALKVDTSLTLRGNNQPSLQSLKAMQLLAPIPINLATCQYGVFCRQELKLDKITPVQVRFRLGSMQQTDWLEGKPGAAHP